MREADLVFGTREYASRDERTEFLPLHPLGQYRRLAIAKITGSAGMEIRRANPFQKAQLDTFPPRRDLLMNYELDVNIEIQMKPTKLICPYSDECGEEYNI